jgi:geranylgeranyl pyrophosphate synthase
MTSLDQFFAICRQRVDETLESLLSPPEFEPGRLADAVRWSVFAGGKRFRPALTIAAGEVFGGTAESAIRCAAAIEMIHTYSLIHDDLPAMDDDDLRRGRETCHVRFDEATAILAGDALQSLAFRAIASDNGLSPEVRIRVTNELSDAATKMVLGQQLDLDGEGREITLDELERIHGNKTGAMIRASARIGGIVAGASESELDRVTHYSSRLGLLFQITDDLLDVTQSTEALGKTAGKDLTAEKATYPAFFGLDETRRLAERVYAEAVAAVAPLERDTARLRSIAGFILNRTS